MPQFFKNTGKGGNALFIMDEKGFAEGLRTLEKMHRRGKMKAESGIFRKKPGI